jgi:hypothetical protein
VDYLGRSCGFPGIGKRLFPKLMGELSALPWVLASTFLAIAICGTIIGLFKDEGTETKLPLFEDMGEIANGCGGALIFIIFMYVWLSVNMFFL